MKLKIKATDEVFDLNYNEVYYVLEKCGLLEIITVPTPKNTLVPYKVTWKVELLPNQGYSIPGIKAHCERCNATEGFYAPVHKEGNPLGRPITACKFRCPCSKMPVSIPEGILNEFAAAQLKRPEPDLS